MWHPPRSDPAGGSCSQRGSVHHPTAPAADPPAAADAAWRCAGTCHTAGKSPPVLTLEADRNCLSKACLSLLFIQFDSFYLKYVFIYLFFFSNFTVGDVDSV